MSNIPDPEGTYYALYAQGNVSFFDSYFDARTERKLIASYHPDVDNSESFERVLDEMKIVRVCDYNDKITAVDFSALA